MRSAAARTVYTPAMLAVGSVVAGRYELRSLIDAGGWCAVWQAMDLDRRETVAIKTCECSETADPPGIGARYVAETRMLARISDPGIVPLRDHGYDPPIAWAVMPLLIGESLRTRLATAAPVPSAVAMAWVWQAATALHAVHRFGVVHSGLRPSRLFLLADDRLVLTDFGQLHGFMPLYDIARLREAGLLSATATYLSPEQACGDQVQVATDIYHLGLVAYECLTGNPPFAAQEPLEVAIKHVREPPPQLPAAIPEPVRDLVSRCLAKSPSDRWPTAAALAAAAAAA